MSSSSVLSTITGITSTCSRKREANIMWATNEPTRGGRSGRRTPHVIGSIRKG